MSGKDLTGNPSYGPEYSHIFSGVECTEKESKFLAGYFYHSSEDEVSKDKILHCLNQYRNAGLGPIYPPLSHEEAQKLTNKISEPVVANSVAVTLAQRGSRYGDFTDHAKLCQQLMGDMQYFQKEDQDKIRFTPWNYLSDVQKQALTVIADKIARILSGDPNYDDNWHDIQGYAKLVEDRLPKESK